MSIVFLTSIQNCQSVFKFLSLYCKLFIFAWQLYLQTPSNLSILHVWNAYLWSGSSYQTLRTVCVSFCTFPDFVFQSYHDDLLSSWVEPVLLAADKLSCSRTQHSDSTGSESQTSNPSIPSLLLYQLSQCTLQNFQDAWDLIDQEGNNFPVTVNPEIFERVLFSQNFAYSKNKILAKRRNHSDVYWYW